MVLVMSRSTGTILSEPLPLCYLSQRIDWASLFLSQVLADLVHATGCDRKSGDACMLLLRCPRNWSGPGKALGISATHAIPGGGAPRGMLP